MVARMMNQPSLASRLFCLKGSLSSCVQLKAIRQRSRRKYRSTAAIVPSWMTALNPAPGSSHPNRAGRMRRCALDDMGRNSVRP